MLKEKLYRAPLLGKVADESNEAVREPKLCVLRVMYKERSA